MARPTICKAIRLLPSFLFPASLMHLFVALTNLLGGGFTLGCGVHEAGRGEGGDLVAYPHGSPYGQATTAATGDCVSQRPRAWWAPSAHYV